MFQTQKNMFLKEIRMSRKLLYSQIVLTNLFPYVSVNLKLSLAKPRCSSSICYYGLGKKDSCCLYPRWDRYRAGKYPWTLGICNLSITESLIIYWMIWKWSCYFPEMCDWVKSEITHPELLVLRWIELSLSFFLYSLKILRFLPTCSFIQETMCSVA